MLFHEELPALPAPGAWQSRVTKLDMGAASAIDNPAGGGQLLQYFPRRHSSATT